MTLKRKRSNSCVSKGAKKPKISYKKKKTYSYKKSKKAKKKMPGKRRSYRRSDPSGGAFRAAASRQRAAAREAKWEPYVRSAWAAMEGRKARREKSMADGYSNRAWGQGRYGLGRLARGAFNAISANEKKHHTLGRAALRMSGLGMYTGAGAYEDEPVSNSLVNNGGLLGVPEFSQAGDETGAISISHREYIADLYGPTTSFNIQSFALNPGLEQSFPWLSQIACNYEEYELHQCIYTYRSTTSDHGSTNSGQVGTIIMATGYNPSAAPFKGKQTMMEYDGAMSGKITADMIHGVECDNEKLSGTAHKYIRTKPVVSGQDLKEYDHGLFQVATANSPADFANAAIGELWVSYTVTLRKPKLYSNIGLNISQDIFIQPTPSSSVNTPFSTVNLLKGQQNNIGCVVLQGSTGAGAPVFPDVTETLIVPQNCNPVTPGSLLPPADIQVPLIGVGILFPAALSGEFEVTLVLNHKEMEYGTPSLIMYGNCTPVNDILTRTVADTVNSRWWCIDNNHTLSSTLNGSLSSKWTFHVRLGVATNGSNNAVFLNTATTDQGIDRTSAVLTIREYNSGFSYSANNVGGPNSNDAIIMVNSSGTVVNPIDGV